MGYETVRLDTGPRQPHAQALYESAGYHPIANFNAHPTASYWGEKELALSSPADMSQVPDTLGRAFGRHRA